MKLCGRFRLDSAGSGQGPLEGFCGHCNKLTFNKILGYIEYRVTIGFSRTLLHGFIYFYYVLPERERK